MPRPLRPIADGLVYHIIARGNNRQPVFFEDGAEQNSGHEFQIRYQFWQTGRVFRDLWAWQDWRAATTLGSGVDGAVRRISTAFDIRGLVLTLSSYDNATVGSGNVVNELSFEYDDSGLLTKEYQEHEGAKDASTLYVQYNRDTTASGGKFTKGLRPTSVRYPNGRLVHFTYGDSGSTEDAVGRLAAIKDDNSGSPGNSFAEYTYLGPGSIVKEDYVEPDVRLDYDSGTAGEYAGFDRFGRGRTNGSELFSR